MNLHRPATLLLLALFAASLRATDLNVCAAASLSDALKEIAKTYERSSGDKLHFNLGASSMLARQIKLGAPADVFFSADDAKMDDLAKDDLIVTATRRRVLSNTLVIVVSADSGAAITAPADLAKPAIGRIALGEPGTVPAGIYAKAFLQKTGLWERIADKVVPTDNVRACLAAVESGDADAGIVYRTDALISRKVRIAYEIPVADGPEISYPVAVLRGAEHPEAALRLVVFLASAEARAVFANYGFLPPR
jgi:molybdate transport system substrate-binding protein